MKKIFYLFLLLPFCVKASLPEIYNYTTDDYPGHSLNFSMIEDSSGIMYIANAYFVLEFDGFNWRKVETHSVSPSAFAKAPNGKIYVGMFSDFGYLEKGNKGETVFISLKEKIKVNKTVSKVYHVVTYKGKIYYCTLDCIYVYDGSSISEIKAVKNSVYTYLGVVGNELMVFDNVRGLGKIKESSYQSVSEKASSPGQWVVNIFPEAGNKYCLVEKDGISLFEKGQFYKSGFYRNGQPEHADVIHAISGMNNSIAIGTKDSGILFCDRKGNILKSFDKRSGLKSNNVNFLYNDSKGNLWAALNNGVAVLKMQSSFEFINELQGVEGMGYSALNVNDTLYLGTSQGLYYLPGWSQNHDGVFTKVKNIGGVIYEIKKMNGRLLCSDVAETYEIINGAAKRISIGDWLSTWTFKKIPGIDTLMVCGTYDNIRVYAFRKGHWVYRNTLQGFKESARMFEFDEKGVLWLVQGVSGLYRIEIDKKFEKVISVQNYVQRYHFPSEYFNDIVKVNKLLKISTEGGNYYIDQRDSLVRDNSFSSLVNSEKRLRSIQGDDGLYIIANERPVFINLSGDQYKVSSNSPGTCRDKLVGSAEFVAKIADNEYIIATQQGFALYRPETNNNNKLPACLIRKVHLLNMEEDSILSMGKNLAGEVLSYANNSLGFYFSVPIYGANNNVLYKTQLSSVNDRVIWKDVSENIFKEYTNLPEGEYTFKVWAEINGRSTAPAQSTFVILPPWYRSTFAYCMYVLALIAFSFFVSRMVRNKINRNRMKVELQKAKELRENEATYKNELLKIELERKNDEMAFLALNFTHKKQALSVVKSQLANLSRSVNDEKVNGELRTIIRSVGVEEKEAENWEKFQMYFDNNNDNFFKKLKQLDPKMNESSLLMCSYIRMGKTNKEIADLLNLSLSGVEKRKFRMKIKFGLSENEPINDFIARL